MIWGDAAIKICGVRTPEHAAWAARCGADFVGVILAPSKRQITPSEAADIKQAIRAVNTHTRLVGVFVNEPSNVVNNIAREAHLDVVQLSGDETSDDVAVYDLPILKTIRLTNDAAEQAWIEIARSNPHVRLHIDAHVAGSYGGAGVVADWHRAQELARDLPMLLAGGLNPENIVEAIHVVQPWGVDVSSGIETAGTKDPVKIEAFVKAAHNALQRLDARRNS